MEYSCHPFLAGHDKVSMKCLSFQHRVDHEEMVFKYKKFTHILVGPGCWLIYLPPRRQFPTVCHLPFTIYYLPRASVRGGGGLMTGCGGGIGVLLEPVRVGINLQPTNQPPSSIELSSRFIFIIIIILLFRWCTTRVSVYIKTPFIDHPQQQPLAAPRSLPCMYIISLALC